MLRPLLPIVFVVALFPASAQTQDVASKPLQGRWVVTGGEHGGKPMDSLKGGVMNVTGNAFEIRTASGNMLKGTLTLDASTRPFKMDMVHADGEVWEAIYETTADTLRLNYVEKGGKDPRPTAFATSENTEESIVMLRRESAQK
jgi:uncharacterized protein (TIGR03067 family)